MKLDLHAQVTLADVLAAAGRFLEWWGNELFDLLPVRWRKAYAQWRERLLLRDDGETWVFARKDGEAALVLDTSLCAETLREQVTAASEIASRPLDVLITTEDVLIRRLDVPNAAVSRIHSVIGLQIERLSPFPALDAAFDCRIVDRDQTDGKAIAEVCIVPRKFLRRYENGLEVLGLSADGFRVDGTTFRLPAEQGVARAAARRRLALAAAAVAALFWLGVAVFTPVSRETELDELKSQIAELRPQAVRAAALHTEFETLQEPVHLAHVKAAESKPIDTLKALTMVLPQTVRISELAIEGKRVVLTGLAKNAPSLIALLEKSGRFADAHFRGPVTRRPDGTDRFQIELSVRPTRPVRGPT